jgi:hypothetical protein
MAISPNTDFTSGQILTATNANQWPRGIMAFSSSTANFSLTTSLATTFTVTFTAVANRYYKVTYYEPQALTSNVAAQYVQTVVKNGATILNQAFLGQTAAVAKFGVIEMVAVSTFTAGSITLTAQATSSSTSGSPVLNRGGTQPAYLLVEDIGLA